MAEQDRDVSSADVRRVRDALVLVDQTVSRALRSFLFDTIGPDLIQTVMREVDATLTRMTERDEPAITVDLDAQLPGDVEHGILRMKLKFDPDRALPHEIEMWQRVCAAMDDSIEFRRAGGDVICDTCGKPYRKHPMDERPEALSYQGEPFLRVLCNGERVKL